MTVEKYLEQQEADAKRNRFKRRLVRIAEVGLSILIVIGIFFSGLLGMVLIFYMLDLTRGW